MEFLDNKSEAIDEFVRLASTVLIESIKENFRERVKEFYCFLLQQEGEDFMPSQYSIADAIDEENYSIINIYLKDMGLLYLESDIITLYQQNISQELPYKVMEVLEHYGLPFRKCEATSCIDFRLKDQIFLFRESEI